MRFLNVGGAGKSVATPEQFFGWEHVLLDIDPTVNPDICLDARDLMMLDDSFDGVYCSHVLEHFYWHEIPLIMAGFMHVLKPGGVAFLRVPDVLEVIKQMREKNIGMLDELYQSAAGPINPLDVFYGFQKRIIESGTEFYAHKTGFSLSMMDTALTEAGFREYEIAQINLEIIAIAHKK